MALASSEHKGKVSEAEAWETRRAGGQNVEEREEGARLSDLVGQGQGTCTSFELQGHARARLKQDC